jgi:endonuclease YncB( thermonuclease family)
MNSLIQKIISGGQTGADRAALDFAIKHKIPHGGWVPEGRIAEDGPLPAKYKLTEMPTDSYQARTEQNVIDSDGTVLIFHGRLTGGSAYTEKMANEHDRPCLHLDLSKHNAFMLALSMINWIQEAKVTTLNIAGPRASKGPTIYKDVMDVLESVLLLESKREQLSASPKLTPTTKDRHSKKPATVDEAEAPETPKRKNETGQPFNQQSKKHLSSLVLNQTVEIKSYGFDVDGRMLGEVFLEDGKNVNIEMVKAGLAEVYRGKPASGLDMGAYWKAEEEAKAAKRGMWVLGDKYVSPREWRRMDLTR